MKIVNVMNFVRRIDERIEDSTAKLLAMTRDQLQLVNEYGVENTFLLQYDAVCDENFVALFKEKATEKTELGLWYEIVEPLTTACGIPYRSERGWKWDWHIIPGYSMAYTPAQRELLIDEAMHKFKEIFGYYPKTVAGWVIDTHTLNYLAANYAISATAICRDQANTDAYTLLGGYFNQAYYPSKNNIFTPAQSKEMQVNVPVFRLLGPCPIHNYDNNKYSSDEVKALGRKSACFTLEPAWYMGSTPDISKWMFDSYYGAESLGFAYAQVGQENSFLKYRDQVLEGTRTQIEQLLVRGDVTFMKMRDTGECFKSLYPDKTPATAVVAESNWDSTDAQSAYYDCRNYTANLFRFENTIFFRSLFLFDERIRDHYLTETCTTFDAIYENLPIVDTMRIPDEQRKACGLMISEVGEHFTASGSQNGVLRITFGQRSVTFFEDRIEIVSDSLLWYTDPEGPSIRIDGDTLMLEHKGHTYCLRTEGADLAMRENNIEIIATKEKIILYPQKITERKDLSK